MALGRALATLWSHAQSCPGDLVPRLFPVLQSPDGSGEEEGPPGRPDSADTSSEGPEAGVRRPPSQRTSHLAMVVDVVPHQFLQFGETLAGERSLGCSRLWALYPLPHLSDELTAVKR